MEPKDKEKVEYTIDEWAGASETEKLRLYYDEEYLKHLQEDQTYLTKKELEVLYEWMKREWISYENIPLMDLVKKIRQIVDGTWHG